MRIDVDALQEALDEALCGEFGSFIKEHPSYVAKMIAPELHELLRNLKAQNP